MPNDLLRGTITPLAAAPAQAAQPSAQAGKPAPAPVIPPMVDPKYGSAANIMALPQDNLVAILKDPGASVYAKAKACQRLAVIGNEAAVPALAALLTDAQLSHYARYGLEPVPGAAADDALRAALNQTEGALLVGIVNSIGRRRDRKALDALAKLRYSPDAGVAQAAEAAIAGIRPLL